jgi:hypothetical protein
MTAATFASNILEQAKLTNDQDCNHVTAACDPLLDWDFRTIAGQEVYQVSIFFSMFSYFKKQVVLIYYKKLMGRSTCQLTQIMTP